MVIVEDFNRTRLLTLEHRGVVYALIGSYVASYMNTVVLKA